MSRPTIASNNEYLKQWDFEKNQIDPYVITQGSKKKAWWLCSKGHSYEMSISQKCLRNQGCPVCSGHKTVTGVNDFATVYPEIAKEWHPIKNGDLKPSQFSKKNGGRFWWMCKYGHEWEATIHDRASGTGCPICKARRTTSFPEQAIFYYVSKLYPDTQNRYRDIFNNGMELDIFIPSIRVGIEFDGANWHSTEEAHNKEKTKFNICKDNEIKLIRVKERTDNKWNDTADMMFFIKRKHYSTDLEHVIKVIIDYIDVSRDLRSKRDNPADIDIERDRNEIKEYLYEIPNSLVDLRPDLAKEWNYEKNGNLKPEMFGINSNDKVWWRCQKCGHEWETTIIHRGGKRNSGCPECAKAISGKTFTKNRVAERGSLADNNPELAKQWHPTKNGDLKPTDITASRFKRVWWLCPVCGHEWEASPNNRNSKNVGCPCCSVRVPKIGVNDLKTVYPDIANEWDYEKNEGLKPERFLPNSNKRVWWICPRCGHEWEAIIQSRIKGHGCPACWNARRGQTTKNAMAKRRKSIVGQKKKMNNGMDCVVIVDNGTSNITVQFEDGTIVSNKTRNAFIKGNIANPSLGRCYSIIKRADIIGMSKTMNCGQMCTVIADRGANDIDVQFEDGTVVMHKRRDRFRKGAIANPSLRRK